MVLFTAAEAATGGALHKKMFLKFRKTHRKTHVAESLFYTVAGLRPATLLKKETLTQVLPCEFYVIFKSTFFTEHLRTTASTFHMIII